tara:strand:+ start:153 stop:404 length:252 start_codon:yes stop_codon:yes gene_type:complete
LVKDVLMYLLFSVVFLFLTPTHLSSCAGQFIIPIIGLLLCNKEIKVPKSLCPAIKLLVPSIGSITQTNSDSNLSCPYSSPRIP